MARITIAINVTPHEDIDNEIKDLLDGYCTERYKALGYAPCDDAIEDAVATYLEQD